MNQMKIDESAIRKLAELIKETGLFEIEYAEGEKKIRVSACPTPLSATHFIAEQEKTSPKEATPQEKEIEKEPKHVGTPVEAPMVGTVYLSPEPGAPPFVNVGDEVRAGDTLLIIEAMKVMNPIKAPVSGVIKQIFVSDAKPVEFGETLLLIEQ